MKLDNFINRPVLSTVISIFIVIFGLLGLATIPIEQYPSIAPPTIQVSTTYTGASAESVMNSVIAPLEEQINGAENMDYMVSTATNDGQAEIQVYFKQGMDPDMAAVDVQNRVAKAQAYLPRKSHRWVCSLRKGRHRCLWCAVSMPRKTIILSSLSITMWLSISSRS